MSDSNHDPCAVPVLSSCLVCTPFLQMAPVRVCHLSSASLHGSATLHGSARIYRHRPNTTPAAEVGFHGRDVDQIIRDLLDNAVMLVKSKLRRQQTEEVARAVEDRILEALVGSGPGTQAATRVWLRVSVDGPEHLLLY